MWEVLSTEAWKMLNDHEKSVESVENEAWKMLKRGSVLKRESENVVEAKMLKRGRR